jgi:AhpC/TSA family
VQEGPEIRLPDLKGTNFALEDFKGEEILVLFCNPECGFCQEMLPDLKEWEASPEGCSQTSCRLGRDRRRQRGHGLWLPGTLRRYLRCVGRLRCGRYAVGCAHRCRGAHRLGDSTRRGSSARAARVRPNSGVRTILVKRAASDIVSRHGVGPAMAALTQATGR